MTHILMAKNLSGLYATDEAGENVLRRIGQGEIVSVEVKKPRNLDHHRLFWALMTLVWKQLDIKDYPTVEDLVTEAKIITGHYTRRDIEWEGKRYPVLTPKSISFAAMDQVEFSDFYDRICDWVATDILPGVKQEDLKYELERMTGIRDS